jgi:hypothetical protein
MLILNLLKTHVTLEKVTEKLSYCVQKFSAYNFSGRFFWKVFSMVSNSASCFEFYDTLIKFLIKILFA